MIRWPWEWRSAYEEKCESLEQARDAVRAERHRYDTLLAMYHELKLQGAVVAPASVVPQAKLPTKERDDVFDAIELQAGNDATLKRHLTRWARTKQLEGINSTEIINAVLHWQADEEGDYSGEHTGDMTLQ